MHVNPVRNERVDLRCAKTIEKWNSKLRMYVEMSEWTKDLSKSLEKRDTEATYTETEREDGNREQWRQHCYRSKWTSTERIKTTTPIVLLIYPPLPSRSLLCLEIYRQKVVLLGPRLAALLDKICSADRGFGFATARASHSKRCVACSRCFQRKDSVINVSKREIQAYH